MKKYLSLIILTVSVMTAAGCAIITYHEKFGRAGDEMAEFNEFNEKYRICKGTVADDSFIRNGKQFYHLQFNGVLAGQGRILNILIPHDDGAEPEIFETWGTPAEGRKTYIMVVRLCCPDDHKEIFDPLTSREIEKSSVLMKQYLLLKFPESLSEDQWPVIFCELSLTNVKTYNLVYKKWNPVPSGKDIAGYGAALEVPYSKMDLKWCRRSMAGNIIIKAGYILPVIIDIVTSPVQLIGFIIYFFAGGAVK